MTAVPAADRVSYLCHEVATRTGYTSEQVKQRCRRGQIPCIQKADGSGPIVPYLIPAEWVEQARRIPTNTGPTAA